MPPKVERAIRHVEETIKPRRAGQSKKGAAIAALKSKGIIKQKGAHLAPGPRMKKGR